MNLCKAVLLIFAGLLSSSEEISMPQGFYLLLLVIIRFRLAACSVGWFVSLLVREEVPLAGLCKIKILFRLEIYDRLRQATANVSFVTRL